MSFPTDPRLATIAHALEETRAAAMLCDAEWNLVWVSEEMKTALDEHDEDSLGIGGHVLDAYLSDPWCSKITPETQMRLFIENFPRLIEDTPGGKQMLEDIFKRHLQRWKSEEREDLRERVALDVDAIEAFTHMNPITPPDVTSERLEILQGDMPPLEVVEVGVRLRDESGKLIGTAIIYSPGLRASLIPLLTRGDEEMFERMARLSDAGRRQAAVLFADLQASAALSRRLSSAAYFKLVRAMTTAIDEVVAAHRGIVGKHVGDGATAFFLRDDLGSASSAVKAVIRAGRDITVAARDAAKEIAEETGLIDPDECLVNVGLHWGGTLYMGQLVTGGRLEVTALGDEVNECARIQESARDGTVLASKVLIEHLSPADADDLGIDPDGMLYRTVGELPDAPDKAVRDAGGIPVTTL